jgi:hypothetical protein
MGVNYTYWNLWATPLFISRDPNHPNIAQEARAQLLKLYRSHQSYGRVKGDPGGDPQNPRIPGMLIKGNIYESSFRLFQEAREKGLKAIVAIEDFMRTQLRFCFHDYFSHDYWTQATSDKFSKIAEQDLEVEISESWVHVTEYGGYHGEHTHPMHSWGGIYYVDAGSSDLQHGQNVFRQPFRTDYKNFGNFFQTDYDLFSPPPENGSCIFFPCNTPHSAGAYYGDAEHPRIVIAINAKIYHRPR